MYLKLKNCFAACNTAEFVIQHIKQLQPNPCISNVVWFRHFIGGFAIQPEFNNLQ